MTTASVQTVDVNIPRFNQAAIAALTGAAFIAQIEWLVALSAATLIISFFGGPRFAPLTRLYVGAVRPRLQPNGPVEFEAAAPPRFAQLLGSIFLSIATIAFVFDLSALGWTLTLTVTVLAALAAGARICVGCLIYERAVS